MLDLTTTNFATVSFDFADPKDDTVPCCVNCGRTLKDGAGWTVCVAEGGAVVIDPKDWDRSDVLQDSGYMGLWDLGPECGKLVPRYYRVKRS